MEKATNLEMPSQQDNNNLSVSYNRRTRSQSLHDLIDSTCNDIPPPVAMTPPAAMTPPVTRNRMSHLSDDNSV